MLKPETIALLATVAAYMLAAARLFNVAKPLYGWIPPKLQPVVIALAAGLPQLAEALIGATTKEQLFTAVGSAVVAFLVAVKGPPTPPGDSPAVGAVPLSVRPPGGMDAELSQWRHPEWRIALVALAIVGCSSAPPKAPCDPGTLAAITARCSAEAAACGKRGGSEAECTAACDEELDRRAEVCR